MTQLSRRRFLAISAAAAVAPGAQPASATEYYQWSGIALGARATITLVHPRARAITDMARAEIDRLEDIFSLYRPNSALARLNRDGRLDHPPFELLQCLGLCGGIQAATAGAFDPTVQPVWKLYAEAAERGAAPTRTELGRAMARVGFQRVTYGPDAIAFAESGMALTLNGIAQGYIADRVAALFESHDLRDVLIDTGELRALGAAPDGNGWSVTLKAGDRRLDPAVRLRNRALASSSPWGTVLGGADSGIGHIFDPATGQPAQPKWSLVSIAAPSAAIADGLSTAGCLMSADALVHATSGFPGAEIIRMV